MELDKIIEAKRKEAQELKTRLEGLKNALDKVKEKFPPVWTETIRDLDKFVAELERWVRNPQVKRARDLLENLKQNAKDTRSFAGLSEDYLVKSLVSLEKATELIGQIMNEQLRLNITKRVLDLIHEEKDVVTILNASAGYSGQFKQFEESKVENDFLKVVKDDLTVSLVKVDAFSLAQISAAQKTIERARGTLQLLSGTGVNMQAYLRTYENLRSVDKVWKIADKIRDLLRRTFQLPTEPGEPFKTIAEILSQRQLCMTKNSLEDIHGALTENTKQIDKWMEEARKTFKDEFKRIRTLADFAELGSKVDELSTGFVKNLEAVNLAACAEDYKKLHDIKHRAIQVLEGKISEEEREIIEQMERANELAEEMGDRFWEAVKSLKSKQLVKIKVERSV
jgi:ABC-type transporter Mla subunit MlaD